MRRVKEGRCPRKKRVQEINEMRKEGRRDGVRERKGREKE